MRSHRTMVFFSLTVAVVATSWTGLAIQSATAVDNSIQTSTDISESCWIDISGEFLIPGGPAGASSPDEAITKHQRSLETSLSSAKVAKVPGGRDLTEMRIDQTKKVKLDKKTGPEAKYKAKDVAGQETGTVVVDQSEADGTWRVSEESIKLPSGTDCTADQLGAN